MKALQRRSYSFDTRSVMLFAALALGGADKLHAQGASPSPQFGPAGKGSTQSSGSGYTNGPAPTHPQPSATASAAAAAFDRADTDRNGQLSAQEVARLPAIVQRFNELDTDKSGTLSREEFEKGAQS